MIVQTCVTDAGFIYVLSLCVEVVISFVIIFVLSFYVVYCALSSQSLAV